MSEPRVQYVGEQNPSITDTITSGGIPQDISSATSKKFKMRAVGSPTLKVNANASFVNTGTDGQLRYDWQAADIDTAGFFLGWWEITIGGKVQSKPEFLLEFRAHGPTAGWLVELPEVRQAAQLKEIVDEWDDRIIQLIPTVTERIQTEVERELVPTTGATRTRQAHGHRVDFSPYDLRTATSVVLDPNGSPKTLVANQDYRLLPSGRDRWGVYTELQISEYIVLDVAALRFGVVEVQVTGDWGFAAVPQIAKEACFNTIRAWISTGASRGSYVDPDVPGGAPDPALFYSLPPSVRNTLLPLYRDISSV